MKLYAGFWIRFAAMAIDIILIMGIAFALNFIITIYLLVPLGPDQIIAGFDQTEIFVLLINGLPIVLGLFYYAWMESSSWQATFGKKILGITVVGSDKYSITFMRAGIRCLAKGLSFLILCGGFLMIAFNKKKQGLHDMIANTRVVYKKELQSLMATESN